MPPPEPPSDIDPLAQAVLTRLSGQPEVSAFCLTYGWSTVPITILEAPWEAGDRRHGRSLPEPCADWV